MIELNHKDFEKVAFGGAGSGALTGATLFR